tara:strand:+ start:261 stop:455 length:195 start_codon:yes stop_codon:yes gene_type:complete
MVEITITDDQKVMMDNDDCYKEAVSLAVHMVKTFYPDNIRFSLCDSTRGVISQIDNMVTGLKRE